MRKRSGWSLVQSASLRCQLMLSSLFVVGNRHQSKSFSGFHTPPKQSMSESPQTQVISPPQNMQETMVVSLSDIAQTDFRLCRFD